MADNEVKSRTVYCLTKKIPDETYDVYVGSTSMSLEKRLSLHKSNAKQKQKENFKIYQRMSKVGLNNWKIVPLLAMECTRDEIRKFERRWCEVLEADLNSYSPIRSAAERYQNNKEEICRRSLERYRQNRGKAAEWYRQNREDIRRKQASYYAKNKEEICRRRLERYRQNREEILRKQAEHRAKTGKK